MEEQRKRILEKAKLLEGISYFEWQKLSPLIDRIFRGEETELRRDLKLRWDDVNEDRIIL